ncbi:MAG TPA: hypothetical protein VE093_05435 [Polyangiaceae bacterium]|jgi:hypothetical protein|nr:hypothetical protein [Polyangiaceae bacterium]
MIRRSHFVWLLVSGLLGCGEGDAPATSGGAGDVPIGPPPPVSGDFRFYADIVPPGVGSGFAAMPGGHVAIASTPTKAGAVAGVPFTHFGPGTTVPNYDLLVAVIDNAGKTAWLKTFATAEIEASTSIVSDEKGDLYVSGQFKDNVDGLDFGGGVTVGIGPGELSSFLVKLSGKDGKALWATSIQSGETYAQQYCGLFRKDRAVRGGRGAIGCIFDADDGTRKLRIVTKAGATEIAAAGSDWNAVALAFDPSSGEPTGSYVLGGVDSNIQSLAITDDGGVVIGGIVEAGTVTDSAGSEPLVTGADTCFVASLGPDMKPRFRRTFSGDADSGCLIGDIAVAGPDRVLIGGSAIGNVDLGDGVASSGAFGFTGVLGADLSSAGAFERFADARVFGVATDVWGQSFVGVATEGDMQSFRYTKRDATGQVVWESKTYALAAGANPSSLLALGLETDKSGALTVFGAHKGPITFGDSVYGEDNEPRLFLARFAP